MIEKIKTIRYEIRSHKCKSRLNNEGRLDWESLADIVHEQNKYHHPERKSDRGAIKRIVWHLQDVLKCIQRIEKEKVEKKK